MSSLVRQVRERWWIWAVPLLLVVIGLGLLANYLMALSGQGKSLLANVDRTEVELGELQRKSSQLENRIGAIRENEKLIDEFYDERLSTESRRLTRILIQVKDLATEAGLQPEAISYQDDTLEDYDLREKSFSFGVEGSYAELRQLIHLLEQAESFLTLEQIGLSENLGAGRHSLRINLRLSTLFAAEGRS